MSRYTDELKLHLDRFRSRYYLNTALRSLFQWLIWASVIVALAVILEGLLRLPSIVRSMFVYGFIAYSIVYLGYKVGFPLLRRNGVLSTMDDEQAAKMVSTYQPLVEDKLLNFVQLCNKEEVLAIAAVERKADELVPLNLYSLIKPELNLRLAIWIAIPTIFLVIIGIIRPDWVIGGSERLLEYQTEFIPPPPYLLNVSLSTQKPVSGDTLIIQVDARGKEIPADVTMHVNEGGSTFIGYPMTELSPGKFEYRIPDIKHDLKVYAGTEEVVSSVYDISILPAPSVQKLSVVVKSPSYTGIPVDTLYDNIGDIRCIRGSTIIWIVTPSFTPVNGSIVSRETIPLVPRGTSLSASSIALEDHTYIIRMESVDQILNRDTVRYSVDVTDDLYPSINLITPETDVKTDNTMELPIELEVSDDFGFTKLEYWYRITKSSVPDYKLNEWKTLPVELKGTGTFKRLSYILNLASLNMTEGDEGEFYLKVYDNDGVSGPKSSVTQTLHINVPSVNQKYEDVHEQQQQLKTELEKMQELSENIQDGMKELEKKMLEKKNLNYDDKKQIQSLMQKNNELSQQMNEFNKHLNEQKKDLQNNQLISEETLKKYEMLTEQMKQMNTDELKKMLEKLQNQMEKMDNQQLDQQLDQMKMKDEDIKNSIERTMELLKQLEFQQKLDEMINKIDNLKQKQDLLNQQLNEQKKLDDQQKQQLQNKQQQLTEEMKKLNDEMKQLSEMNQKLQNSDPQKMEDVKQDGNDAQQNMQDASDQLSQPSNQNNKQDADQKQKDASNNLQKMKNSLSQLQSSSMDQQDQQNLEDLRYLLENLLKLSFDQEELRDQVKKLSFGDADILNKANKQKELYDDMMMVNDSLMSLANRVFQIKKFVLDEAGKITTAMDNSMNFIEAKNTPMVVSEQTKSMTSLNNLANMLSEVMAQMMQMMQSRKPGSGMCQKPGGNSPNMSKLGQQQQQLNQQMSDLLKLGGKDPKKLGELGAQQEELRMQLEDAIKQMQEKGQNPGSMMDAVDKMKQTEEELMNKQLSQETLLRQQEILNRLLDSQKSMREKEEYKEERESNTGNTNDRKSPSDLTEEELKNRLREELLKVNYLELSPEYLQLIDKYYKLLEKQP